MLFRLWMLLVLAAGGAATAAPQPSPHAIEIPRWFTPSLLDLPDEVAEAARHGKRVMVYFGQDGCPYCKALMQVNFGPGPIADKTRANFVAVAINIWGDTEVTWLDRRRFTEKTLARELQVQFTPTLMFFETDGRLVLRVDGWQPPERFAPLLEWVVGRHHRQVSLADWMATREGSGPALAWPPMPYLLKNPAELSRQGRGRPLAVMFESARCPACAELHRDAFARPALRRLLGGFDVARLVPGAPDKLQTPDGRRLTAREWSRELRIQLHPTVVFFDAQGREAFRFDGTLRPFHVESAFDYVASGAYRSEPQFQRFVQARADKLRAAGQTVDLWR